jgi:hypothetical protein
VGEIEKRERMMRRVPQYAEVQILKRAARVRFRKSELAASRFDSDFGKGYALSSRMWHIAEEWSRVS